MQPVRWGILSTAKIGRTKVVPGLMKSPLCNVVAVASRDEGTARAMAAELGIPKAYGSYEELLADPGDRGDLQPAAESPARAADDQGGRGRQACAVREADRAHRRARREHLRAGRDRSVLIAEAFMVRFHPQWLRAREIVREGRIGDAARRADASSPTSTPIPPTSATRPISAAAALYDIGCYAIVAGRFFLDAEPTRGVALIDRDPGLRHRPPHQRASWISATDAGSTSPSRRSSRRTSAPDLAARKGRIEIQIPFNAPQDEPTRIFVDEGSALANRSARAIEFPAVDQYPAAGRGFQPSDQGGLKVSALRPGGCYHEYARPGCTAGSETSAAWTGEESKADCGRLTRV